MPLGGFQLGYISVLWTDGNTIGTDTDVSSVSLKVTFNDNDYEILSKNVSSDWVASYRFSLCGSFTYRYHQSVYCAIISAITVDVPLEYYN